MMKSVQKLLDQTCFGLNSICNKFLCVTFEKYCMIKFSRHQRFGFMVLYLFYLTAGILARFTGACYGGMQQVLPVLS